MFKYVIAVAFLSSVALGNFNPFDREWDEDAKAYCIEKCEDYCTNCTEPVRCGEGQKKCGEKPIDPQMSQCTPDDICVPEECECKYIFRPFTIFFPKIQKFQNIFKVKKDQIFLYYDR